VTDPSDPTFGGRLPAAFLQPGSSSFTDFLASHAQHLLPGRRQLPAGLVPETPHATTIVTVAFEGGVVMGGDRGGRMGKLMAQGEMGKVVPDDGY